MRLPDTTLSIAAESACESLRSARHKRQREKAELIELDFCRVVVRLLRAGGPKLRKSVSSYFIEN